MISYSAVPIDKVDPELLRDLNTQGKNFCVIRESQISIKAWSFHTSMDQAKAAVRRWRSRDIVTR